MPAGVRPALRAVEMELVRRGFEGILSFDEVDVAAAAVLRPFVVVVLLCLDEALALLVVSAAVAAAAFFVVRVVRTVVVTTTFFTSLAKEALDGLPTLRFLFSCDVDSSRITSCFRLPPVDRGFTAFFFGLGADAVFFFSFSSLHLVSFGLGPRIPRQAGAPQRHS